MNWLLSMADAWLGTSQPEITYQSFRVQNFRGIDDVSISLKRSNLALLLGLNESGKTSLLRAIESFDYRNDPDAAESIAFFGSMRNKKDPYSQKTVEITARLKIIAGNDTAKIRRKALEKGASHADREAVADALDTVLKAGELSVTRCIEFKGGTFVRAFYRFDDVRHQITSKETLEMLARAFVSFCPFIIYFEDFKDRIPDKIYISPKSEAHDSDWTDILEGLFHHTDKTFTIGHLQRFYSSSRNATDDARTVLRRVNKTLNKVFTDKWQKLSGVKDIEAAEVEYHHSAHSKGRYFQIKIHDADGTAYSVDERSKGALWYLSFLMKTEFRRKKIRGDSGQPIFLIDEPASNLHSTAQRNMVEDFKKLVEDTCVIYTTHSQYLISLDNIQNTYVVRRENGSVTCEQWGSYIRGRSVSTDYFQPLADVLQLVPNNFDMPCARALIVEGPSDMNFFFVMGAAKAGSTRPDVAIYPGTSAANLEALISLNLGWGSDFKVLLDGDGEGAAAAANYAEKFQLNESSVVLYPDGSKLENLIDEGDLRHLSQLVSVEIAPGRPSKKEFALVFARLRESPSTWGKVFGVISDASRERCVALLSEVGL